MKHIGKLLSAAGTAALFALSANAAHAAGTAAGSTITNTAQVSYTVGGVAQTAAAGSNSITVDAKITLTAVNVGPTTLVSPGQSGAVTTFQITNSSNMTIDVGLSAIAQSLGATTAHGQPNSVTATSLTYYVNTNGSTTCSYSAGNATQVTYLEQVAAGATPCVYVLANIPLTATSGQVAGINLTATAESASVVGTQGAPLVQSGSSVAWTPGTTQIVFADGFGTGGDLANDGKYSALADYTVNAPQLAVYKNSYIVSDPVNMTTNPKAIPGATLGYCIVVTNASTATASATNIAVTDVLPTTVTYKPGTIVLNAAVTGSGSTATCGTGTAGSDTTNYSAATPTVSGTLSNLAPGTSLGLSFQATIN